MIYQEIIFTKEECDTIINYKNKYESILVTDPSSLIPDTRTVYHKEENYSPYFKFLGKTYENGIDTENEKEWIKKYNVWDIPTNDETIWFYDKIYDWFINVSGVPLDKEASNNMAHKLHEYVVGDKFDLHVDADPRDPDMATRIWNLGIQLNSDYVGGDYICYDKNNNPTYISNATGNVVAYTSDVPHKITEILEGSRYTMVIKVHSWQLLQKSKKSLL